MGCSGCSTGGTDNILDARFGKLLTTDWLKDIPDPGNQNGVIEIQFKNTRKQFFVNPDNIDLVRGDLVVVESSPGHDIGRVSLQGKLAELQFRRKVKSRENYELKKIYRVARENDLEKFEESRKKEFPTSLRAHKIAASLNLEMKISDVEYQGDGRKAIFYYTADGRVDFRQLIREFASEFKVRIEMKQIGARQEAGMIGGIGSCGRELCCSSWRTDFNSISIDAARIQELPASAQKLAGQCGKLKCCLMFELETYLEAKEDFPKQLIELELAKGKAIPFKIDVLKKVIWYNYDRDAQGIGTFMVSVDRVKEILDLNKRGKKPEPELDGVAKEKESEFISGTASIREDRPKKRNQKNRNRNKYRGKKPNTSKGATPSEAVKK